MRKLPIRWRLTLWYGLALASILVLAGTSVYWLMRAHLAERMDKQLAVELASIDEELEESSTNAALAARLHRRFGHYEQFHFDVRAETGLETLFTRPLEGKAFPPALAPSLALGHRTEDVAPNRYRVASRQIMGPQGSLVAQVATSLAPDERELRELIDNLAWTGAAALVASLFGGYILARRALAPIDRITRAAQLISAGRLSDRIGAPSGNDELGTLATTFNEMIARLEQSFVELRRFTADAAHELRTPLAVMRSEAEVTLRQPRSSEDYRKTLESQLEELARMSALAEQLLYLCRNDTAAANRQHRPVRWDELVTETAEHVRIVAHDQQIRLETSIHGPCVVSGDNAALRQLTLNLLDNAVKYTPAGGDVRLHLLQDGHTVRFVVEDTGVGIAAEHLAHIGERFYRVDAARQGDGSGLGLAICRAIVAAHDGNLRIASEPGLGTTVTVELPALEYAVTGELDDSRSATLTSVNRPAAAGR